MQIKPMTYNESQAAEAIGVSASTMAQWRKNGVGPEYVSVKMPGKERARILYPIAALEAWLTKTVQTA